MSEAILFLFIVAAYFMPFFIAISREHPQTTALFALNLLLGWTFVGWAAAMVWAFIETEKAS